MKTRRRVRFAETDASGRVHFTEMLKWVEEAEHEFLRQAGVGVFNTEDSNSGWPRVKVSCDYRQPVAFGDEVEIALSLQPDGQRSLTWSFRIHAVGREGSLVAEGEIVTVRVNAGKPAQIDEELRQRLESFN